MLRYTMRRLVGAIPTMFALIAVTFFLMRVAPGGPFDGNRKVTAAVKANLEAAYHLDEPLWMQFFRYLWRVLHFDFGPSFKYRDYTVTDLIAQGFPVSFEVGIWAILIAAILGMTLGTIAALRQHSFIDYGVMAVGMVGVAVPTFVAGPLMQIIFALSFKLLPVAGWDGSLSSKILPITALALPNIAYIASLARGSMIESLRTNHVRTARAKGIGGWRTVTRHALLGAMVPVVAYLGPATAGTVTGSIVIEKIFSIPGIGRYFVDAALNRDYTLVLGVVIFYGFLIIIANLIVDLCYAILDPKVRYD
ncbi:MAG TPA: ABC transporter permease subunit [Verrucomicrobiae bacterium]|jgi:oligopeptide transport system permease protein|nr:ABC transporter permease subunit [Verrucomicrobiae bacterium]